MALFNVEEVLGGMDSSLQIWYVKMRLDILQHLYSKKYFSFGGVNLSNQLFCLGSGAIVRITITIL